MLPAETEQSLIARYSLIEDHQERLSAVMSLGKKQPAFAESERTEDRLVKGCSSRVWIAPEVDADGRCRFRVDADSALIKGLAVFLCLVYQGATLDEVAGYETTLLESLHLSDHLSPTRRNGLTQVRRTIREWAQHEAALRRA